MASPTPSKRDDSSEVALQGLEDALLGGKLDAQLARARVGEQLFDELVDTKVGRFTVLGRIGAGGMGVVYAAYDPKLDRKVAIKFLHKVGRERTERFAREARAMAAVSHPNLVRVHQVDEVEGQLFIAMEFVDGQDLSSWSGAGRRSWQEVLDVFIQAGRGLRAVHEAGLVHRDFKPSNVLVGEDGRVRIADFGIAAFVDRESNDAGDGPRVLEPPEADAPDSRSDLSTERSGSATRLTRTGAVLGTPAYMAPEQRAGLAVGPAADQYSFCLALFEALAGHRPARSEPVEDLDVPRWLARAIARGLSEHPTDRFPDMGALLAAIARPARSRRSGLGWLLGGVGIVGLGLGLWASAGPGASERCAEGKDRAALPESTRSEIRAAFAGTELPYADETWSIVERRLDDYASQWSRQWVDACESTHTRHQRSREVLELTLVCLQDRREALEALTETLASADASTMAKAIQATDQLAPLENCTDLDYLRARVKPPDPELSGPVADARVELARARSRLHAGQYEQGLELATALQERVAELEYPPLHADIAFLLGALRQESGDYEGAIAPLEQAYFDANAARYDELAAESAARLTNLVGRQLARHEDGLRWSRHAKSALSHLGSPGASIRARVLTYEGLIMESQGDYAKAAERHRDALSILDGESSRSLDRAAFLSNLGAALDELGEQEQAEQILRRAIEILEEELGVHHPSVANAVSNLGRVLAARGRYPEAEAQYRRALDIVEQGLGSEHRNVGVVALNLGIAVKEQGRLDEAETLYRRALAVLENAMGPDHPHVGFAINNLGNLQRQRGRHADANKSFERSLEIKIASLGPDHPSTAATRSNLGLTLLDLEDLDGAERELRRAKETIEQALGPGHARTGGCVNDLGKLFQARGDLKAAEEHYRRGLAIREEALGESHPDVASSLDRVAEILILQDRRGPARDLLTRSIAIREATDSDASELCFALTTLARIHVDEGEEQEARALVTRAAELCSPSDPVRDELDRLRTRLR